jgi:hypothetical protein
VARLSKKEIKAALDKLKDSTTASEAPQHLVPKLEAKKASVRIRKKGV